MHFANGVYAVLHVRVLRPTSRLGSSRRVHFGQDGNQHTLSRSGSGALGLSHDLSGSGSGAASGSGQAAGAAEPPAFLRMQDAGQQEEQPGQGAAGAAPLANGAPSSQASTYRIALPYGRHRYVRRGAIVPLAAVCMALVAVAAALLAAGRLTAVVHLVLLALNAGTLLLLLSSTSAERMSHVVSEVVEAVACHLPHLPAALSQVRARPPPLRLQLLGGGFARDPMGLLEQQVIMIRWAAGGLVPLLLVHLCHAQP